MNIGKRTIGILLLSLGLAGHLLFFFFLSKEDSRNIYNFYTLIGGYISAAGIIFTLFQLKSVSDEAESIRKSVSKYNNILTLVEIISLSNYLSEARDYILNKDFKTVYYKLSYIKPGVNTLISRISKQKIEIEQPENSPELKDLVFNFKQDLYNIEVSILNEDNFENLDFSIILRHTEELSSYFLNLTEHLKSLDHES